MPKDGPRVRYTPGRQHGWRFPHVLLALGVYYMIPDLDLSAYFQPLGILYSVYLAYLLYRASSGHVTLRQAQSRWWRVNLLNPLAVPFWLGVFLSLPLGGFVIFKSIGAVCCASLGAVFALGSYAALGAWAHSKNRLSLEKLKYLALVPLGGALMLLFTWAQGR